MNTTTSLSPSSQNAKVQDIIINQDGVKENLDFNIIADDIYIMPGSEAHLASPFQTWLSWYWAFVCFFSLHIWTAVQFTKYYPIIWIYLISCVGLFKIAPNQKIPLWCLWILVIAIQSIAAFLPSVNAIRLLLVGPTFALIPKLAHYRRFPHLFFHKRNVWYPLCCWVFVNKFSDCKPLSKQDMKQRYKLAFICYLRSLLGGILAGALGHAVREYLPKVTTNNYNIDGAYSSWVRHTMSYYILRHVILFTSFVGAMDFADHLGRCCVILSGHEHAENLKGLFSKSRSVKEIWQNWNQGHAASLRHGIFEPIYYQYTNKNILLAMLATFGINGLCHASALFFLDISKTNQSIWVHVSWTIVFFLVQVPLLMFERYFQLSGRVWVMLCTCAMLPIVLDHFYWPMISH